MEFKREFLKKENGKRYMFTFNKSDEITVGITVLSGRKTPISSHYNGQYKLDSTGEVIVLQDSQIVALLADFDADFVLEDTSLNAVKVLNEEGDVDLAYINYGEGLLNVGTAVYDDPNGDVIFADGAIFMGRWKINLVSGLVDSTEEVEAEVDTDAVSKAGLVFDGKKITVYVKGSPKLVFVVGTVLYSSSDLDTVIKKDGVYTANEVYFITVVKGSVTAVSKRDPRIEGEDPVTTKK